MSRVGKKPITVPSGVEVTVNGKDVTVKGPKGTLTRTFFDVIEIKVENNTITFERPNDLPAVRALHGTARAVLNNMILGVSQGFRKTLDLVGVGYRAKAEGKGLEIALGYSHPVIINAVDGITFTVEGGTKIHVDGIDKTLVGQISADIRSKRAPEPYKGKGVKYSTEVIRRKEGKKS
jgi:large subunit ribosomal protein L6